MPLMLVGTQLTAEADVCLLNKLSRRKSSPVHLELQWETTMYYFICFQKKRGRLDAVISASQLTLSLHSVNSKSFPSCPLSESPMVPTAAE